MSWVRELQVGDPVYVVFGDRRSKSDGERRVMGVGRQYVTLNNGRRYDRDTGSSHIDDVFQSELWRSEAEWLERVEATAALALLRNRIGYAAKPGVTADDVRQAAALLRVELDC